MLLGWELKVRITTCKLQQDMWFELQPNKWQFAIKHDNYQLQLKAQLTIKQMLELKHYPTVHGICNDQRPCWQLWKQAPERRDHFNFLGLSCLHWKRRLPSIQYILQLIFWYLRTPVRSARRCRQPHQHPKKPRQSKNHKGTKYTTLRHENRRKCEP